MSNQTPTPRTDAKKQELIAKVDCGLISFQEAAAELASLSCDLERELAAANKRADEGWDLMTHRMEQRDEAEKERDQLRAKLNHFIDATTKPHSIDDATIREWDLANKNAELRAEVDRLKGEMTTINAERKETRIIRREMINAQDRKSELLKDKERLDWLQTNYYAVWTSRGRFGGTDCHDIRQAIDAAFAKWEQKNP